MSRYVFVSAVALLLAAVAATASVTGQTSSDVFVRTVTGGQVEGMWDSLFTEGAVSTWKGIPFAAPPVGELRFAPTAPVVNWTGVKKTQKFSDGCIATCYLPRPEFTCTPQISEDCLYLNVYTPTNATGAKLPVLMFIHGGAYITGSAGVDVYEAAKLAYTQQIVVVTANYRLGLIGALYTGTVKGNFQTMDQRQTMQWIQDNIDQFGGDKTRVTISGQSAGAMSCGVHMTAPKSWGLFHGAIMASNPLGLPYQNVELATKLGHDALKKLNCPIGGQAELSCLRNKTSLELLIVSNDTRNFPWPDHALMAMVPWVPVVDGEELPMQPLAAAASGNFSKVPVIAGSLSNDSMLFIQEIATKPLDNVGLDVILTYIFGLKDTIAIKHLYGPPPNKKHTREYFSHIGTDYMFFCPIRAALRGWSSYLAPLGMQAYQYVFSHLPSFSNWLWKYTDVLCQDNVCHSDDLPFVFASWFTRPGVIVPTEDEKKMSDWMQDYWGTFVRQGNLDGLKSPSWANFTTTQNIAMDIQTPQSGPVKDFQGKYCDYFDTIGYNRE